MGLQTFDENGGIMLDTSDRLCRYIGVFKIHKGEQFIKIDKQEREQFWWYFLSSAKDVIFIRERQDGILIESGTEKEIIIGVY